MRKLISSAMAVAAIGALTAPAYAADATKSGAVKIVEQPSTVASHDGKLITAAKEGLIYAQKSYRVAAQLADDDADRDEQPTHARNRPLESSFYYPMVA